jgi:hypothetical protein
MLEATVGLPVYILKSFIIAVLVAMVVFSILVYKHFKGSHFEKTTKYFATGFFTIGIAMIISIIFVFLLDNHLVPLTYKWAMSLYEVFGVIGLSLVVYGLYRHIHHSGVDSAR